MLKHSCGDKVYVGTQLYIMVLFPERPDPNREDRREALTLGGQVVRRGRVLRGQWSRHCALQRQGQEHYR